MEEEIDKDSLIESLRNDIDLFIDDELRLKSVIDELTDFIGVIKREHLKTKEQLDMTQNWIRNRNVMLEKFFSRYGLTLQDLEEFENERLVTEGKN